MGAMENKGLNIFNSKYVLCSPDTSTDADIEAVRDVVAHEYLHNWTGNRVTCRSFFELTLVRTNGCCWGAGVMEVCAACGLRCVWCVRCGVYGV
jgi:hypothetical protein